MKLLILVLVINFVNVNCGLLKELLTPVTEKVQNNELLDENERKNKEPVKKGVLTNVVESLDTGADKLVNLLTKGKKGDKGIELTTKPADGHPKPASNTQKPTPASEEIEKDLKTNTTVATTNTNATTPEDNKVKDITEAEKGKEEKSKEDEVSVTPASKTDVSVPTVEPSTGLPDANHTETKATETAEVKNK